MSGLCLVTGGTGFVGRQVLRALREAGVPIRVVVRDGTHRSFESDGEVESIITTADLFTENAAWWADACDGIDTVIHIAWYAEPGTYLHSPKNLECLLGTLQAAQGAVQAKVRRFVGVGTCFEYDVNRGMLSVDTPLQPTTPYGGAKAAAFLALSHWLPAQGTEFAWCRLFYLYGEGEDGRRLVPYLRARLEAGECAELTGGNQIRDFLDVREAGRLIVQTALGGRQGAVNICSGIPVTVRELAGRIADEHGRRDLLRFGARQENTVDPPCVVGVREDYSCAVDR